MRRRPRCDRLSAGAVAAVAVGLILTSCTSGSAGVHLQTADPPSMTAPNLTSPTVDPSTISTPQPVLSSAPGPVSSGKTTPIAITAAPTVATKSTASNPWPANFTAAQQTYAKGALAAFNGFTAVAASAEKQPSKDWTKAIRKYTADPTAAHTLDGIASLATAKVHATTTETHEAPRVVSATAKEVVLESCVDGSKAAIADASGKKVDLRPSPHPRVLLTYNVYQYGPKVGGWLVSETVAPTPVKPC